jgi:hypothetical protein
MGIITGLIFAELLVIFKVVNKSDELGQYIYGFGSYLIPILVFYFVCFRNRKYRSIITMFKNEGQLKQVIGRIVLVMTIIFFLFF